MSHGRVSIHVNTINWWNICWSRHVLQDSVQKFLNTFVSICRTAAYRNSCTLACTFSQSCFQSVCAWLFALKIFHHEIVIQLTDLLDQFCMIKLSILFHVFRDIGDSNIIALLVIVDVSFHFE